MLLLSFGLFVLLRRIPGDPAVVLAGLDATPEQVSAIRHELGLDQPLLLQYAIWGQHALHGDLGTSLTSHRPVLFLIGLALRPTLELLVLSLGFGIVVGLTSGVVAATRQGRFIDHVIVSLSSLIIGVPIFWFGLLMILTFSLHLAWLPPGGFVDPTEDLAGNLTAMILPGFVLGLAVSAGLSRFTRSAMLEVLNKPYITFARAKGLREPAVVWGHGARSALIPVITVIGITIGRLVGGAIFIEVVFFIPGTGRLVINAIQARDYPLIEGSILLLTVVFVVANLLTDIAYGLADPRVRVG